MAWLCVNRNLSEYIFEEKPFRGLAVWLENKNEYCEGCVFLPKGSIKKLIGRELKWSDEPAEI